MSQTYTVNKYELEDTVRTLVTAYLDKAIPYNKQVEFHGIVGIRLDGIQEFFICLDKFISRGVQVKEDGENVEFHTGSITELSTEQQQLTFSESSACQYTNVNESQTTNEAFAQSEQCEIHLVLAEPEAERLFVKDASDGDGGILQCEAPSSSVTIAAGHDYAQTQGIQSPLVIMEGSEVKENDMPEYNEDMRTNLDSELYLVADEDDAMDRSEPSIELLHVAQDESSSRKQARKAYQVYKQPPGHLTHAPCECCHVLARRRQKDASVTARKRAATTGKEPPPYDSGNQKIIYKLARGHVDACMCCKVLADRRSSTNQVSRNRREKEYVVKEAKRRKLVKEKIIRSKANLNVDTDEKSQCTVQSVTKS